MSDEKLPEIISIPMGDKHEDLHRFIMQLSEDRGIPFARAARIVLYYGMGKIEQLVKKGEFELSPEDRA